MADLCLRQGHHAEGMAIYRRLLLRSADDTTRERIARRIAAAEQHLPKPTASAVPTTSALKTEVPLSVPSVRVQHVNEQLTIEWRLTPGIKDPALEILLITRGPSGVATETRAIDVNGADGRITLTVKDLHLARVAVGSRASGRFVPAARA